MADAKISEQLVRARSATTPGATSTSWRGERISDVRNYVAIVGQPAAAVGAAGLPATARPISCARRADASKLARKW